MTKQKAILVWVMLLTLIAFANAWLSKEAVSDNQNRIDQICRDSKELALIEHTLISGEQAQGEALIRRGATFGLKPKELQEALDRSHYINAQFLKDLDAISNTDCEGKEHAHA